MKFDHLSIAGFKCYSTLELTIDPGVTVIHGVNGSGKSTLLDACFFALYGADTLDGATLDEVITTGEETARVSLSFTHDGASYRVTRELRVRDDRAHTTSCVLETPTDEIEGARAVATAVTELLRMDADAFLNCAYVRQGEVNKLIHAAPSTRQDMIDELLQLGVLEDYRNRATEARRGIASLRDDRHGQRAALASQIEAKEEKELPAQLNEAETRRTELDAELERLDDQIEAAKATREEATTVIEQYEDRREELTSIEETIEDLRRSIAETEDERAAAAETQSDHQTTVATLREEIQSVHTALDLEPIERMAAANTAEELETRDEELREAIEETRIALQDHRNTAERLEERADDYENRAANARAEAEDRATAIQTDREALAERRASLAELVAERDDHLAAIEEAGHDPDSIESICETTREQHQELRTEATELAARREALAADIEEAETLRDAGKCPTCGQDVHGAPVVESIAADRKALTNCTDRLASVRESIEDTTANLEMLETLVERRQAASRLTDQIDGLETLIAEREATIEERATDIERLRADAEDAAETAADARAKAAERRTEADDEREQIASLNAERQTIKKRRETLQELLDRYDRCAELEREIDRLAERQEQLTTVNDERRDRLADLRERRRELHDAVDEERVETARKERRRAEAYLEDAGGERERLDNERDVVIDRIGRLRNELDELTALREQLAAVAATVDAIETLHDDVETLETTYTTLREELRERNVVVLERIVNEVFGLLYQNDAYDRIELDRSYRITVYQKDGEPLRPDQLSGGERALFNLSLRCAIYRLLSEGIEGTGPLPPFILDEPTVFLDAGHVNQLVDLIDAMRRFGVEQILLVTHDDELLRAADAVVTVEKDPTSNRSTVTPTPRLTAD